jgi:hypothetical protein
MNLLLAGAPDPMFLAAALEASNVMSGIDDITRKLVFERLIELTSPGALAAWETRSDAIEHLEVVAQMFGRQRPNNRGHSGECLRYVH